MNRYTIIIALFLAATSVKAQDVWEKPTDEVSKKEAKEKNTPSEKKKTANLKDAKYLAGAVTEKDGKVVWTTDIEIPGKSTQCIYDATLKAMQKLTKGENQLEGSSVSLVNKQEHIIVAAPREWLTFTNKFLSLDRAEMNYVLIATCSDGKLHISMERIKYLYEENGRNKEKILAEDAITDKNALNKKKTRLVPGWARFRRKTIDRKDEIFKFLEENVKGNIQ